MDYVIINAIIYVVTVLIYWRYRKQFDLGFFILIVFASIAVLAIPHHFFLDSLYKRSISFLPFIYLYVVLLLFIRPYFGFNLTSKIKARSIKKLERLVYLFVIASFISIYAVLPFALANIESGEWSQVRNELYEDDLVIYYSNFLEHLMLIINQYLRLIAILILFYFIGLQKHSVALMILLGLSCVIPTLLVSVVTSSRGTLVGLMMEFVAGFIIFKQQIPPSIKKIIYFSFLITIAVFLIFSIAVTDSRFGQDSGYDYSSSFSVLDYFGQPMLVFNDGIASMHNYANGKYFFKFIFDALSINSDINQYKLGGNWGLSFFTFIGAFYIDFGPFGTFFLALILSYFILKNIKRRVIYFENLYLYYFFYIFFLEGVFVTGYSSILTWIFAFIIYFFLRTTKITKNYE